MTIASVNRKPRVLPPDYQGHWLRPSHSRSAKTRNCVTSPHLQDGHYHHRHSLSRSNSTIHFFAFSSATVIFFEAGNAHSIRRLHCPRYAPKSSLTVGLRDRGRGRSGFEAGRVGKKRLQVWTILDLLTAATVRDCNSICCQRGKFLDILIRLGSQDCAAPLDSIRNST
jgi:hypothetical protein